MYCNYQDKGTGEDYGDYNNNEGNSDEDEDAKDDDGDNE